MHTCSPLVGLIDTQESILKLVAELTALASLAPLHGIDKTYILLVFKAGFFNAMLVDAGLECLTLFNGEHQLLMQGRLSL